MPSPYNPNPANDPTIIEVPDDADAWTASVINPPTESMADSIAFLRTKQWLASSNWPWAIEVQSSSLPSTTIFATPPVWDPAFGRWVSWSVDSSGGAATSAYQLESEDGHTWIAMSGNLGGGSGSDVAGVYGMFVRPTDGAMLTLKSAASAPGTGFSDFVTNAGTLITGGNALHVAAPGTGKWWSGGWWLPGSFFIIWQGGAVAATITPLTSDGTTAWAPPTSFTPPPGFIIHNLAHILANPTGFSIAILFPSGTSVVSSFMYTTDAAHWFTASMPTFTLSSEAVIDACYDTFTQTIYLLTGNSATAHLWSMSPTALGTWTLVRTLNGTCYGMRANGRELLIWITLGHVWNGSSLIVAYRPIVSVDGGTTWRACPLQPSGVTPASGSTAPNMGFCLRANGQQFLYMNPTQFAASLASPLPPIAAGP